MFPTPPRRGSFGYCPRTFDILSLTSAPIRSVLSISELTTNERPLLKRQATAPLPVYSYIHPKRARTFIDGEHDLSSEDVHAAFLEALRDHPPTTTWKPKNSLAVHLVRDTESQGDYLREARGPGSAEQSSGLISTAFQSPPGIMPHSQLRRDVRPILITNRDFSRSHLPSYISQLHGDPIPYARMDSDSQGDQFSASSSLDTPSMSRRRQALNRPILNLHLTIPLPAVDSSSCTENTCSPGSGSDFAVLTPSNASLVSFSALTSGRSSCPSTPVNQCYKGPLIPPQAPRVTDVRRNTAGRWIPTPTEGIIPILSSAADTSPISPYLDSANSGGSGSFQLNTIGSTRPKMSKRALSWLSIPRIISGSTGTGHITATLASPFSASDLI